MSKSIRMKGLPGKKRGGFPGHQVCSRGMGPDELAYIYIYIYFFLDYCIHLQDLQIMLFAGADV